MRLACLIALTSVVQASAAQILENRPRCTGDTPIIFFDLRDEDRPFYLENTVVHKEYLSVGVPLMFITFVDDIKKVPGARPALDSAENQAQTSLRKLYIIQESPNRRTTLFSYNDSEVAYTRWDVKRDQGKICIPRDFVNTSINSEMGILSLMTSIPLTTKCLWKLTWPSEQNTVNNEFYVKDVCTSGRGKLEKSDVLMMANHILQRI